jgi:hypothetical protein
MVADMLPNELGLLILHKRLVAVLAPHIERGDVKAEVLPVVIKDERGKVRSRDHSIVNLLGMVECIDAKRSSLERTKEGYLVPKRPVALKTDLDKLTYSRAAIAAAPQLFRVRHHDLPMAIAVREDLRAEWVGLKPAATNLIGVELKVV